MTVDSVHEGEQGAPEGIFIEAPLSFAVLESLFPISGSEIEDSVFGPVGQEVEEVTEVGPGLEAVHLATRDEGDEYGVGESAVVGADEEPIFSAESFPLEISLGDIVRQGEPPIVEEALERFALIDGVAGGGGDRGLVEDEIFLRVAPGEEVLRFRGDGGPLTILPVRSGPPASDSAASDIVRAPP